MESITGRESVLHHISLPARRDYQLRSCPAKISVKDATVHLPAPEFFSRTVSFHAPHGKLPSVYTKSAGDRESLVGGPLPSRTTPAGSDDQCHNGFGGFHARQGSEDSMATPEVGSSACESFRSAGSQDQESLASWEEGVPSAGTIVRNQKMDAEEAIQSSTRHPVGRGVKEREPVLRDNNVKSMYPLTSRKCVSGELKGTDCSAPKKLENPRRSVSGELGLVASDSRKKSSSESGWKQTTPKVAVSSNSRPGEIGAVRGVQNRGDSKRRPTASIAWDSLNKSPEDSPQREVVAIPFKWEEAPGRPKTIAAAAERALARKLSREGPQRNTCRDTSKSTPSLEDYTSSDQSAAGTGREQYRTTGDVDRSFSNSHRYYYARLSSKERSFGARSFTESDHLISEVETEAHIDLVAPSAAKFLVESCGSPNATPLTKPAAVPFKWEETPGKPKVDAGAPKLCALQLPPRLVIPPQKPDSISREGRLRHKNQSMSGPLSGFYPPSSNQSSPFRRHQSPPVKRSCSPSKRSCSPSRIQALAKHLTRKGPSIPSTPPRTYSLEDLNWPVQAKHLRHTFTSGCNSIPIEKCIVKPKGATDFRLGKSVSGAFSGPVLSTPSSEQDLNWPMQSKKLRNTTSGNSDRLEGKRTKVRGPTDHPLWRSSSGALSGSVSSIPPCEVPHSSELSSSDRWSDNQHLRVSAIDPSSPRSILCGPSGDSKTTTSVPSSGSDIDSHAQSATPPSISLSKSLSTVSYESFEQSFREEASPTSTFPPPWDAGPSSPLGSPYLGPTTDDYMADQGGGGASEGMKALIKLCRTGSSWRKSKNQQKFGPIYSPEVWEPTLATYFQGLELDQAATMSGLGESHAGVVTNMSQVDKETANQEESSPMESPKGPTRLPYTMPSVADPDTGGRDQCRSPDTDFSTCLGVRLSPATFFSPARFLSRGEIWSSLDVPGRGYKHSVPAAPTNHVEEGYRSPAYAATLELLSPSANLILKRRKGVGKTCSVYFPSPKIQSRTSFVEAMCKSLKHAIYKCARRCGRKTGALLYHEDHGVSHTEFSFCKPT